MGVMKAGTRLHQLYGNRKLLSSVYMIKVGLIVFLLFFQLYANSQSQKASCNYVFTDSIDLYNSRIFNLKELLQVNKNKDFYIIEIEIFDGKKDRVRVRESSGFDGKFVIREDGFIDTLDFSNIKIDSSSLINKFAVNGLVFYYVSSSKGSGFHTNEKILLVKLFSQVLIGYSFDGCDLHESFKSIASSRFIFPDEKFKNRFFAFVNFNRIIE